MLESLRIVDALGPAKVLHLAEASSGLRAAVVVDNTAAGPSIGGIRMAPDVTLEECARLARAMTLKNAAAGLAHGGGKAVIAADPRADATRKEALIRAFAQGIRGLADYIPGPDMGTDERAMAWIQDEIGRAVGLPPELGGIPLNRIGATGFGLCVAARASAKAAGIVLKGARVAVQGFGAVGRHAARFLVAEGAVLVAASDSRGAIHLSDGIDVERLIALKEAGSSLAEHPGMAQLPTEAILDVPCEIWIPAARPDVIHAGNAGRLQARLILQGVNIPITAEAEADLHRRGVLSIPDFIANAGGVICAAIEYRGGTKAHALQAIEEKIAANVTEVLRLVAGGMPPRGAAMQLARRRVEAAVTLRRRF